jgi:uncharacterized protein YndB with AHSA1/START domain
MMTDELLHPAVHSTFRVERYYDATPARVFHAFADTEAKRRWFVEGDGWEIMEFSPDFRVGGTDVSRFRFGDGPEIVNRCTYHQIDSGQRLVYCYTMAMAGAPMSVSLATIELVPQGSGTMLVLTEQGTYLDGQDDGSHREAGTRELLEALAAELAR